MAQGFGRGEGRRPGGSAGERGRGEKVGGWTSCRAGSFAECLVRWKRPVHCACTLVEEIEQPGPQLMISNTGSPGSSLTGRSTDVRVHAMRTCASYLRRRFASSWRPRSTALPSPGFSPRQVRASVPQPTSAHAPGPAGSADEDRAREIASSWLSQVSCAGKGWGDGGGRVRGRLPAELVRSIRRAPTRGSPLNPPSPRPEPFLGTAQALQTRTLLKFFRRHQRCGARATAARRARRSLCSR